MANSYEYWKKLYEEQYAAESAEKTNNSNVIFDQQANQVKEQYGAAISDTDSQYKLKYDENAVQKLINERQIAEDMANSGLTDSGLNRTQQTANQLSYANNKAKISLAQQKAIDSLASEMNKLMANIQTNKLNAASNIKASYNDLITKNAMSNYQAQLDADSRVREAQIRAQQAAAQARTQQAQAQQAKPSIISKNGAYLSRDYMGELKDNGVRVIPKYKDGMIDSYDYIDTVSGKKSNFSVGCNPYTGNKNADVKYGTFSNGYQPNNIGGDKLTVAKDNQGNVYKKLPVNGNPQTIWTVGGKFYLWDGSKNKYIQVKINSANLWQEVG